eukprot:TRINITY_DN17625_c0_g3_i1.p1 TRINITY_DN17625_c0_g3~~TRINITY_DN17625_c0_g3_i1.p1  ORF type:complete len:428 (-),score=99.21 TRINITY_DN17625_c0_g3_i1:538-1821(-)
MRRHYMLQIARGIGNARKLNGTTGTAAIQLEANCCIEHSYKTDAGSKSTHFIASGLHGITHGARQGLEHRPLDRSISRWARVHFSTRSVERVVEDTLVADREPTSDTGGTSYDGADSESPKEDVFSFVDGGQRKVSAASTGGMGKKEWRQWINRRLAESTVETNGEAAGGQELALSEGQSAGAEASGSASMSEEEEELSVDESLDSLKDLMASLEESYHQEGGRPRSSSGLEGSDERERGMSSASLDEDFGFVKDFTEIEEEDGFLSSFASGAIGDLEDADVDYEVDEEIAKLSPVHDLDDESHAYFFRPGRPYFPGQTYDPEDLDLSVRSDQLSYAERKGDRICSKNQMLRVTDFRNVRFLAGYITETSNIVRKSKTKTASKAQRKLVREVKTARIFGLLPFTTMGKPPFRMRRLHEFDTPSEEDD